MNTQRYEMLDALRGIAAITVVGLHLAQFGMIPVIVPRGYLAVDFFFVLSGFIVAHAYERNLQSNLSLRSFIARRFIRLYPLALLGAAIGIAILILKWHLYPSKAGTLGQILSSGALNIAMLPSLTGAAQSTHELFPGNGPLWSLFFELFANLLWAIYGIWCRTVTLILIIIASLIALIFFAAEYHTLNIGYDTATFWGGFARVCFGFPLGVVIHRERHRFRINQQRSCGIILIMALIAAFAVPADLPPSGFPWTDLFLICICLPVIVVAGTNQHGGSRLGSLLGDLSYPIYVLHFPLLLIASGLSQAVVPAWNTQFIAMLSFIWIMVFAWIAGRYYDKPIRRALISVVFNQSATDRPVQQDSSATATGANHQPHGGQVDVRI